VKRIKIYMSSVLSCEIASQITRAGRDVAGRYGVWLSDPNEVTVASHGTDVTDQFITQAPAVAVRPSETVAANPREVFVAHGRNKQAQKALHLFLQALDLVPLDFEDYVTKTGSGGSPYIGQILDTALTQAQTIVVLLTPDDEAKLKPEFLTTEDPAYETELSGQARPNVLFEAGMAIGMYPDRTILVQVGKIRPFSDVEGRHILKMDNSPEKRNALVRKLESTRCSVKVKGVQWLTAGDFDAAVSDPLEHLFDE
jgi:predicted nucleotide-binding protein